MAQFRGPLRTGAPISCATMIIGNGGATGYGSCCVGPAGRAACWLIFAALMCMFCP
jgi:hypothetical protein